MIETEPWSVTRAGAWRRRYSRCRSRWSSRPSGLRWWRQLALRRCWSRASVRQAMLQ